METTPKITDIVLIQNRAKYGLLTLEALGLDAIFIIYPSSSTTTTSSVPLKKTTDIPIPYTSDTAGESSLTGVGGKNNNVNNKSSHELDLKQLPYASVIEAFNELDYTASPSGIIELFTKVLNRVNSTVLDHYTQQAAEGIDVDFEKISLTSDDLVCIVCYVLSKVEPLCLYQLLSTCQFLSDYLYESVSSDRKKFGKTSRHKYYDSMYMGEGGFALATIQAAAQYFCTLDL